MKKVLSLSFALLLFCLAACGQSAGREDFLALRAEWLAGPRALTAAVSADYGARVCDFRLRYEGDGERGTVTVLEPEEIEGVSAELGEGGLRLGCEGVLLETGALPAAESPLLALPKLVLALRQGFVTSTWRETLDGERTVCAAIDCSAAGDEMETVCTVWFTPEERRLRRAEISVDGAVQLQIECEEG